MYLAGVLDQMAQPDNGRKKRAVHLNYEASPFLETYKWTVTDTAVTPVAPLPIPVYIVDDFTVEELDLITAAADFISDNTCIVLEVTQTDPGPVDKIVVTNRVRVPPDGEDSAEQCYAFVGKFDTPDGFAENQVNLLSNPCLTEGIRTPLELFFATLGTFPEQVRPDRDDFVAIDETLVPPLYFSNYEKGEAAFFGTSDTPYDYTSITHSIGSPFPPFDTLDVETANPLYQQTIGSSYEASFWDVIALNRQYCYIADTPADACTAALECGVGFQNPAACDECICPSGYAGVGCADVEDVSINADPNQPCEGFTSGTLLTATDTETCINSYNHEHVNPFQAFYQSGPACSWRIQAELEQCVVEARFDGEFGLEESSWPPGNPYCIHWVELKYQTDQTVGGPRFCGSSTSTEDRSDFFDGREWLRSETREMPVIFDARQDTGLKRNAGFRLCYRQNCPHDTTPVPTTEAPTTPEPSTPEPSTAEPTTEPPTTIPPPVFNAETDCLNVDDSWSTPCSGVTLDNCAATEQFLNHGNCNYPPGECSQVRVRRRCGTCTDNVPVSLDECPSNFLFNSHCYANTNVDTCCDSPLVPEEPEPAEVVGTDTGCV